MVRLAADLHIHTSWSPCASRAMSPAVIVAEAVRKGIEVIAVCDHNCLDGVLPVMEAAGAATGGPRVIPGIEITTVEEVHVLGYFESLEDARAVAHVAFADVSQPHSLGASRLSLGRILDLIHDHGGLAVAAHVDRGHFSVPSQLGFLSPDLAFDGLEISGRGVSAGRALEFSTLGFTLVSSSDSHEPGEMGSGITALEVEEPTIGEMRLALRGMKGRRCVIA
jgi:3',5'-nucleoside bisphosphate phosphatase